MIEWISVKDGVPNTGRIVWTWNKYDEPDIGAYNGDSWSDETVTHWAEINPPKIIAPPEAQ